MTVSFEYTLEEIEAITGGRIIQHPTDLKFFYLVLDSRKILYPGESVFFAIKSAYRHGSNFINDLYKKGVMNFIIDEEIDIKEFPRANFVRVQNSIETLHALAIHHRTKFAFPVIGIAGSNGKTIVKEWLNQLFGSMYNIVRSPRSYNSQIGVPLSILQMNASHTLGIFEAGISEPGEMQLLERIIQPTIGILTNIGTAHDAGFSSKEEKLKEKLLLFRNAGIIICRTRDLLPLQTSAGYYGTSKLFTWGLEKDATLFIESVVKHTASTNVRAIFEGEKIQITFPFTDEASTENLLTCFAAILHLKISPEFIKERLATLRQVEMRLELKQGINHCSIVNDSYSADIPALAIALDFLSQQHKHVLTTVILSDILESGRNTADLYKEVADILSKKGITRFIGIGKEINSEKSQFSIIPETYFFDSVEKFCSHFPGIHFNDEIILLKGARVFGFEKISRLLEQKVHQTVLSINLSAISHNLREYKKFLNHGTKIMAMVKAFSYGSGSFEIASLLQFQKVDYLAVAYADEGVELRKAGITLPIMVMNPEESTFSSILEFNLQPELFSFFILSNFEDFLVGAGIDNYPVHIKIDTGMHRLGFDPEEINDLGDHLAKSKKIHVQSVFSHLVASEDFSKDHFSIKQASDFNKCCLILEEILGYGFIKHISNTSAIHRHPFLQMDMVRIGIGLYGIDSDKVIQEQLKNVGTLTSTIAQVKSVKRGDSIGYGANYLIKQDSLIATVRIGYADGYPRSLSHGNGKMLVGGVLVPVIGSVCMDMTMLDMTGCKNIREGDEVIVYGENLKVQDLAKWANTITYDIISGISQRVKRVYFEE